MNLSANRTASQTELFSRFAFGFRLCDAPDAVQRYARLLIMDLIGCAIGALNTPEAISASRAAKALDPAPGTAALWGTGRSATPQTAALFNGIIAHTLELDDFLGIDHTGAVVIPALIAVADHQGDWDEERFLEAMIIGYEIGRRLLDTAGGYSVHNRTGWHTTGTLGGFAAAAAVSKYLGLDVERTTWALGQAGSVAGGTWAFRADGSMSKRLHPGIAAQHGLTAAFLAREGFTGPRVILEADWGGYFALFAANHNCDVERVFTDLGSDFRLGWTGIKPYACCRGCHSAIDAVFAIRDREGNFEDKVTGVEVTCSPAQYRQLGNTTPTNNAEAQLSLPYAIAIAIRFGDASLDRFTARAVADHDTLRISRRVTFSVVEDWPPDKEPEVTISLSDGPEYREHIQVATGDPRNPLPTKAVVDKFLGLTSGYLSSRQQEDWIGFGCSERSVGYLNSASASLHQCLALATNQ